MSFFFFAGVLCINGSIRWTSLSYDTQQHLQELQIRRTLCASLKKERVKKKRVCANCETLSGEVVCLVKKLWTTPLRRHSHRIFQLYSRRFADEIFHSCNGYQLTGRWDRMSYFSTFSFFGTKTKIYIAF